MSGLIYGAIVLIWVAVLVPMWLRRHDDATETKSVDRFSTAMKVLARRTNAPDVDATDPEPSTVMTDDSSSSMRSSGRLAAIGAASKHRLSRAVGVAWTWLLRPISSRPSPGDEATPDSVRRRRPAPAAVRRQRVLAVLVALTVLMTVLAWLALVPWIVVAASGLLLMAYVVLLRALPRRAVPAAGRGTLAPRQQSRTDPRVEDELNLDDLSHTVKIRPAVRRRRAPGQPVSADVVEVAAGAADSAADSAAGSVADVGLAGPAPDGFDGPRVGWDPVPVPSPTYVNAPRAPRAVRSIDLSGDGAWTSGRLVADAKAAAAAAVARSGQRDKAQPARQAVGE